MNSFNDEVCEYAPTSVTENFVSCPAGSGQDNNCPSGCRWSGVFMIGFCT
jgi:hypothetical protein